jgi:hypothetical protein
VGISGSLVAVRAGRAGGVAGRAGRSGGAAGRIGFGATSRTGNSGAADFVGFGGSSTRGAGGAVVGVVGFPTGLPRAGTEGARFTK